MNIIPTLKNPASSINVLYTFCRYPFLFFLRRQMDPAPQIFSATVCSLFVLLCGLSLPTSVYAWEVNTHEELTEQAIRIMEGDLNTYLIQNLGLEGGLGAPVEGGTPRELMIQGSNTEDNGIRFLNHFHYPISNVGLPGLGESAIKWSLRSKEAQWFGEFWSWNDAREYYFKALTSETKKDRDKYWGKTFRALGQVMHLLQDSANPSHVRDDLHAFDDGLHDYMARQSVTAVMGNNTFSPDPSLLEETGPAGPNGEPFANLFDRDMYHGSAPEATLGTNIGVTEYTNANFFSDDTIPGQGSIFGTEIPHPTVAELVPAPVPSPYLTLPRLGSAAFPGARAAKLTGNQAAAKFVLTNTNLDLLGQLQLDDAVYEGQSINLIPRAVGYSAAVLTYFFRGELPLLESEPHHNTYEVCHNPNGTFESQGVVSADLILSPELKVTGTVYLFYDLDGILVLGLTFQITPSSPAIHAGAPIPLAQLPFFEPVRWTLVLDGKMGPGELEDRAILGKTELVPWLDRLCPI